MLNDGTSLYRCIYSEKKKNGIWIVNTVLAAKIHVCCCYFLYVKNNINECSMALISHFDDNKYSLFLRHLVSLIYKK